LFSDRCLMSALPPQSGREADIMDRALWAIPDIPESQTT
jgi:hypothetical protein